MPKFRIVTNASALIREIWEVEASSEDVAIDAILENNHDGCDVKFISEKVIGEEEERELMEIEQL